MRILLVEDDPRIIRNVKSALEAASYAVDVVSDGETAWFAGDTQDYDAVILDLGLPSLDGLAVLTRWRAADRDFPVLIVTARGAWTERVQGIDGGADDYLTKPFAMEELLARVRALTRRAAGRASAFLSVGRVGVDTRKMQAFTDGRPVNLTTLEYRCLSFVVAPTELMICIPMTMTVISTRSRS